ncbi:bifunctional lytic transglycosylase/C40 family peptidase [Streptomyces sp. JV185]|uniref:C40 family peptidase n=1 Tax=Streptomyces sp. JV185 TaxID=858638 RepID=UPI002E79C8F7|nr:bifunctional lytic transglycosylase/C40 family peptidase [Streptomyces sp. JV185]MEE1769300.1 bifunctional lytic transglycosylase/C40 family peptidase [Streptomyces sp. JV185]
MRVKRWLAVALGGAVMTPVAFGMGIVLLVATFDDDSGEGSVEPTAGSLRIGRGGVPAEYAPMILKASADCDQGLPPSILAAQLKRESNFDPRAESPGAGAQGIAQFMPDTWPTWAVDGNSNGTRSVWEPADAIAGQGRLMCSLLRKGKARPQYKGSPIELALAAYNSGWGRVDQYRGVPDERFADGQTYNYVNVIMATARQFTAPASSEEADLPAGYTLPADTPREVRTAVSWALQQKGGWYHLGGDCTDAHGGSSAHWCDCSSLMQQAYRAAGISIPRVTYDQVGFGDRVGIDDPRPGDLVFNPGSDGSDARPGHVGMYIGDGRIIEAPRTGVRTRIVSYSSWRNSTSAITRITEVRRVVKW